MDIEKLTKQIWDNSVNKAYKGILALISRYKAEDLYKQKLLKNMPIVDGKYTKMYERKF